MRILGIDWGKSKIGISISYFKFAEPLAVIKGREEEKLMSKIKEIVKNHEIKKVVVGISESRSADETEDFIGLLQKLLEIPVERWDETLTTQDAQRLSIEAGLSRVKRKKLLDAFSATLMLQSYLDKASV